MDTATKIVECEKCGAANRIKPHSARLRPICGRCGNTLPYKKQPSVAVGILWNIVLLIALAGAVCGMVFTPFLLGKDFSELKEIEDSKTSELRKNEERKLVELESRLKVELAQVDPAQLHNEAAAYYSAILDARKLYDKRYALTPREKAQLKMQELATDSNKSYREAIKAVALEASPKDSDVDVVESLQGMTLRIDFDMSSMTSGEYGTRTKHTTKESLKKEVITLISRVTNDVFQFCGNLDLQAIYVGCRHYVSNEYPDGSKRDENTVLYKICIRKKQMPALLNNPFLDVYSTTQYFDIEEDNFDDIRIVIDSI
jgi:ribosomal protein S27AE